jgi:hypothetical protein
MRSHHAIAERKSKSLVLGAQAVDLGAQAIDVHAQAINLGPRTSHYAAVHRDFPRPMDNEGAGLSWTQ